MKCCDGTGWTGEDGVICPKHYEPCGSFFDLYHED